MALKFVKIEPRNDEEYQSLLDDDRDSLWFSGHYGEIQQKYRGKYVAVVNEELFVGDSPDEAEKRARAKYPECQPLVDYVPYKQRIMVL